MIAALGRLWRLCAPERGRLVRGYVLGGLASLLRLVPALAAAVLVARLDDGLTGTDAAWAAAICGLSLLLRYVLARIANGDLWVLAYHISGRIRHEILDHTRRSSPTNWTGRGSGEALTVLAFDGGKIAGFLAWEMPTLINGIVLPVATVVAIAWFEPALALPAVAIVLIAVPVLQFGLRRVEQVYHDRRRLQGDASERMLEYVRGIDVIRAHDLAGERQVRFREALHGIRDADTASVERLTPAYSAFQALIDAGYAAVLAGVGLLVANGSADSGDLIAALILTTTLFRPQLDMGARALHLPELAASLSRIETWLATPTIEEPSDPTSPPAGSGVEVCLRNVVAGYEPGVPVLHGLDLTVPPRSVTAIVGTSGAGKSTVLRAIAGLIPVESGSITVQGVPVDAMLRADSAALVTAVMQEVGVLQGPIVDAIAAGDPAIDRAAVERAARAARIHDRITALPRGYETELGEDGSGLSGGERQRIAIARAMAKPAPIVLLDEATSALDPTSERLLREALANLTAERTVIVVAHRLETIRHADRIVFVDDGRIVESGTHEELVASGGAYAGFWSTRERAAGWTLQGQTSASAATN